LVNQIGKPNLYKKNIKSKKNDTIIYFMIILGVNY